ncbi:hypothetical protein DFJ73DRAFT_777861 [Zopfochytrium polystomum]|nr:hypothetical protein DFJ73DRAFT_777861 [Zopfochytrium polystomum]
MRFSSKAVSAALAAAFGMAKFFGHAAVRLRGAPRRRQSSRRPDIGIANLSAARIRLLSVRPSLRLTIETERQRKNFVEDGYKGEYERDKDKDTKRINHYEAHPSKNCYAVCGGQKTLSPADCSKKKFRSELSLYRRAIEYLFEDDDAWDENRSKAATPAKGAASSSSSSAKDDSAGSSKKSSLLSSLNPFKSKAPNPDEVKHVKVGGGLLNKFRPAEEDARQRAEERSMRRSLRADVLLSTQD